MPRLKFQIQPGDHQCSFMVLDFCEQCWPPTPSSVKRIFAERFLVTPYGVQETLQAQMPHGVAHQPYGKTYRCDVCRKEILV